MDVGAGGADGGADVLLPGHVHGPEDSEPEVAETEVTQPEETAAADPLHSFPPELIELIAQKVAERISDKAIRDIAWEVVPQMTELILKKMAEEKLKE